MSDKWREQKERGSDVLLRFMAWLGLSAGRPVSRLLLFPICAYFLLFSVAARRASRQYLTIILGRPAGLRDVFRHYHTFSATILDRVFFLKGRFQNYEISIEGLDVIDRYVRANKGFLLLGAHLGSFEVLHTLGVIRAGLPIKAMMYPENSRQINALRASLNAELVSDVIVLGSPTAMLEAKEHVDSGGVVGILGDRIVGENKAVQSEFFGRPALFPEGPMLLASLLRVPVIMMCGLYKGGRRYEIHFELFADAITIRRDAKQTDLQVWIDKYVSRLEHYCRAAPYNWFNFYDFWEQKDARP